MDCRAGQTAALFKGSSDQSRGTAFLSTYSNLPTWNSEQSELPKQSPAPQSQCFSAGHLSTAVSAELCTPGFQPGREWTILFVPSDSITWFPSPREGFLLVLLCFLWQQTLEEMFLITIWAHVLWELCCWGSEASLLQALCRVLHWCLLPTGFADLLQPLHFPQALAALRSTSHMFWSTKALWENQIKSIFYCAWSKWDVKINS